MRKSIVIASGIIMSILWVSLQAQTLKQSIRGRVTDADTKMTLIGVTLSIHGSDPLIGTVTGMEGDFKFDDLPVGRYTVAVNYLGYETKLIPNVLIGAGKQAYLDIELVEDVTAIKEVVVTAKKNKGEPLNEMASVSARSLTVEETQRYAGSFNDPAGMASGFAGVVSDAEGGNELIIRGNSPRGMQWMLEGVPISNPNHFAEEGATGGPISILNTTTLSNSDFFTGAFPAQYGNAFSGVFDVNLRKGNDQEREYTLQAGILGVDISAEGPFSKNSQASYLVNYRYSSLDIMNTIGIKVAGDAVPKFQDATFKVVVPTQKMGRFEVFGVGGLSNISFDEDGEKEDYNADMAVVGVSNIYPIGEKTYLHSNLSYTGTRSIWKEDIYNNEINEYVTEGRGDYYYNTYRAAFDISHKFSAKNTIKTGVSISAVQYDLRFQELNEDIGELETQVLDDGQSTQANAYANWKFRPVKTLTFNTGIHVNYLQLNNNISYEPRIGVRWQFLPKQALSAGYGMHSKSENISLYLVEDPFEGEQYNKNLDFIKAHHYVVGYENQIRRNLFLKVEAYYQDLYDVPVEDLEGSYFSMLNETNGYITEKLVNKGTGTNYGLELTLEKYFSNNYYFLITSSLFQSKYKALDGKERNTRFNNQHINNIIVGKEWPVGKKNNSTIALNIRGTYAGGNCYTPIDVERSMLEGETVRDASQAYAKHRPDYVRFDTKISYRKNKKKTTRVWELDIRNVTNTLNVTDDYWDNDEQKVETYTQLGLLPVINYRIEF